jgi:hypothetical protein
MFKKLLVTLGLASAPRPYRRYARFSPLGLLPVVGYFAWRNRDRIKGMFQRVESGQIGDTTSEAAMH